MQPDIAFSTSWRNESSWPGPEVASSVGITDVRAACMPETCNCRRKGVQKTPGMHDPIGWTSNFQGQTPKKTCSISSILYGEYIYIYIISLCKHLPSIHKSAGKWLIHGIPNKYPRDVRCMNGVDY